MIPAPCSELVRVDGLTGARNDERHPDLPQPFIGDADDRDLTHQRMAHHDAFDLGGIGVEAADDVHVLLTISDTQIAVPAQDADVPGAEPPVLVDCLLRGRRILEIFLHDIEASHEDLTRLIRCDGLSGVVHNAHVHTRKWSSYRAGDDFGRVVVAAHADRARCLGQPVTGDDRIEAQLVAHAPDHFHRNDGGSRHRQTKGRQIERREVGMIEDRLKDRGRSGQHCDPLGSHTFHHRHHVEHGVGDDGRAASTQASNPDFNPAVWKKG